MRLLCVLTLLTAAALPDLSYGGWGGSCGPVGPMMAPMMPMPAPMHFAPPPPPAPVYTWRPADTAGCYGLFRDGFQVGWYSCAAHTYRPRDGDDFGTASTPPIDPPACACCRACKCGTGCKCDVDNPCCPDCRCGKPLIEANYGLDLDQLGKDGGRESYKINGREVSKREAVQAIEGGQLPDDSNKLRLTVIGPDAERQAVVNDLKSSPILASVRNDCLIQDYAPDAPMLAGCGFVTTGHPTIYVQKPDGTVLHRQDDYTGGAEALATAVRKADPNYHPDNDPNKTRPDLIPGLDLADISPLVWLAGGGLAFLLLWRKRHAS